MSENRRVSSSNTTRNANRNNNNNNNNVSQENVGVRKSVRLMKSSQNATASTSRSNESVLQTQQHDSAGTSSSSNNAALPSPTALEDEVPGTSSSNANEPTTATTTTTGKSRKWKAWDSETENLFFDALKLYGKDYDAITKYIAQKVKSTDGKNYEQVRNYFHNTASKVLAVLDLTEIDASKEVKEVFTLINYGEWKRKTNSAKLNLKCKKIFSDLVLNGYTTVKVAKRSAKTAGRSKVRPRIIRTPLCPALKKFIDGRDDITVDTTVPKSIALELSPCNQRDRSYVLGCWQNPLVRFVLSPNQPISDMLRWLRYKWIPGDLRMKKKMLGEDITNELPDLTIVPSPDMVLRSANFTALNRRIIISAPSTTTSGSVTTTPFISLGLRQCFGPGGSCLSLPAEQQRRPASPAKVDKKRKKSVASNNNSNCQNNATKKSKRASSDMPAPVPAEEETNAIIGTTIRRFSDAGEAESSCDNFPVIAVGSETDDELDPAQVQGVEQLSTVKKPDLLVDNSQNAAALQQPPPPLSSHPVPVSSSLDKDSSSASNALALHPNQLRQGINVNTCSSLTAGQLYLMCDKADTVRLKYNITPQTITGPMNAKEAWNFFVSLARSEFSDALHKKLPVQSSARSNVKKRSAGGGGGVRAANASKKLEMSGRPVGAVVRNDLVPIAPAPPAGTTKQPADALGSTIICDGDSLFADPAAMVGGTMTQPASYRFPQQCSVTNESNAFLMQMGQMISKKPVVVSRRRTVVAPRVVTTGTVVAIPSASSTARTAAMNQCQNVGRNGSGTSSVLQATSAASSAVATTTVQDMRCHAAMAAVDPQMHSDNPQEHNPVVIEEQPAVITDIATGPVGSSFDHGVGESGAETGASQTVLPAPSQAQDIITSDSFLDLSLTSFPGFNLKPTANSQYTSGKNSLISSLNLDVDDSALSSPPRPIRAIPKRQPDKPDRSNFQLVTSMDAEQCPSTSNLFSLFDNPLDNESATTRDFFAECAAATTLETPEKRKPSERQ